MHVLLRSMFHLSRLREHGAARVSVVVDAETGVRSSSVFDLMRPWRGWLTLDDVVVSPTAPSETWFCEAEAAGMTAAAVISERSEFVTTVCELVGEAIPVVGCSYETSSPRDAALLQEVCHHHYEFGGLNEWDGKPAQYSPHVLQHLSAANCERYFPCYALTELRSRFVDSRRPVEALDVGSGPVSRLRWGVLEGLLHVTAADPLLEMYDVLLAYHGLDRLPAIRADRAIATGAEHLGEHTRPESFEFACCFNTLDHVENPAKVIEEIARVLLPGGALALEFATREGTRQGWRQLHKFDLFLDEDHDRLMCQAEDGQIETLVSSDGPFEIERAHVAHEDYTALLLRRKPPVPVSGRFARRTAD